MKHIANIVTDAVLYVDISNSNISVQHAAILELLGYDINQNDDHINDVIDNCIAESYDLLDSRACIYIVKNDQVRFPEGRLYIKGKVFEVGKIIASQIRKADLSAFFICTIGNRIERLSKEKMNRGDLLEGYIFDLIGSTAVEEVANQVHDYIKEIALKAMLRITNRYSPGYCNWDVKEQFKLFDLFQEKNPGVRLTDSALMNPVKSVSGLIGIGENVRYTGYTCSVCDDKKCIYRNRKISKI